MKKRVFLIVLDSLGIGAMPDSAEYGDVGVNTLRTVVTSSDYEFENLRKLGLFNINGIDYAKKEESPVGAYCRFGEISRGKDTTIGHWEIGGIISEKPLPTYPNGFPDEVISEFTKRTGKEVTCNKTYSGTEVIKDYGEEHLKTGKLIVYTSADSVFQIAAHEDVVPLEKLYEYCRIARDMLRGEHAVGRVIARPFVGEVGSFTRSAKRHDYSIEPPEKTILDYISKSGKDVISVGKIYDIFTGQGITEHVYTKSNAEGMEKTLEYAKGDFSGLCFVNLVDFDMLYGHRNNISGYADALNEFDLWLPKFMSELRDDDVMILCADHGCDPGYTVSTDHSREYIPCLIYGRDIKPIDLGVRYGFCDIGKTVCDMLSVDCDICGNSFYSEIRND